MKLATLMALWKGGEVLRGLKIELPAKVMSIVSF
jgi:hypothetical protein